ncbi:MAG: hypothetical protein WKF78_08180 [Candidatus Limnocylindrales bacterium]
MATSPRSWTPSPITIRERVRIKGEIQTLTAQQRLSGYVVAGLPISSAGFLFVVAPGFMDPMFANPPEHPGPSRRRDHPRVRRVHDVHRLHAHPQDRGYRGLAVMPILPLLVAAMAAGAILLIVVGLAGSTAVDPVQARLTQLGTMQAKNLEELELQAPFMERTLKPARRSPLGERVARRVQLLLGTNGEAPGARRQPGRTAGQRTGSASRRSARSSARSCSSSCSQSSGSSGSRFSSARSCPLSALPSAIRSRSSGSAAGSRSARS